MSASVTMKAIGCCSWNDIPKEVVHDCIIPYLGHKRLKTSMTFHFPDDEGNQICKEFVYHFDDWELIFCYEYGVYNRVISYVRFKWRDVCISRTVSGSISYADINREPEVFWNDPEVKNRGTPCFKLSTIMYDLIDDIKLQYDGKEKIIKNETKYLTALMREVERLRERGDNYFHKYSTNWLYETHL